MRNHRVPPYPSELCSDIGVATALPAQLLLLLLTRERLACSSQDRSSHGSSEGTAYHYLRSSAAGTVAYTFHLLLVAAATLPLTPQLLLPLHLLRHYC